MRVNARNSWRRVRPTFLADAPGFFSPPKRWTGFLLTAVAILTATGLWRAGLFAEELEERPPERDKIVLEKPFDRAAPAGPGLEADLNEIELGEEVEIPMDRDLPPAVIDEDELDELSPRAFGTDVALYSLTATGDTLVLDNCPRFWQPDDTTYALVLARYANLDAALDAAFDEHARTGLEVNACRGDCLGRSPGEYYLMIGKPSAAEGEVNLRFRRLRRDHGLAVRVIALARG